MTDSRISGIIEGLVSGKFVGVGEEVAIDVGVGEGELVVVGEGVGFVVDWGVGEVVVVGVAVAAVGCFVSRVNM